jgi:hypothetical protein
MRLSFTIAAGPRQRSHSQVRFSRNSWPHFTVPDSRLLQRGGPDPRIYIPQEQGGPVIPLGTGFPFRRIHTESHTQRNSPNNSLYSLGSDRIKNTVSNSSFIVAFLLVVSETLLSSRHLTMDDFFWFSYSCFQLLCYNTTDEVVKTVKCEVKLTLCLGTMLWVYSKLKTAFCVS